MNSVNVFEAKTFFSRPPAAGSMCDGVFCAAGQMDRSFVGVKNPPLAVCAVSNNFVFSVHKLSDGES